jgi:GNAT superfamily N-acetyltransferase
MVLKRVKKARTMRKVREIVKSSRLEGSASPLFHGAYYVLVDEEKIKGTICVKKRSWYLTELRHLVVLSEYRRQGIAKSMVLTALGSIQTPLVCCTVRDDNPICLRLFHNLGFEQRAFFEVAGELIWLLIYQRAHPSAVPETNPTEEGGRDV